LRQARIIGTGGYVPPRVVTNDDLARRYGIETDDAWIRSRTGIEERRYADEGVGTADLGAEAARRALEAAGLSARDVDLIVFCTLSPDRAFPGSGVFLQAKLGIPADDGGGRFTPCLDVRDQCSGFLYGLSHAVAAIRSEMAERVLVVGAEVHSAGLDLTTRGRAVASLFGDGAGAVVVAASDEPGIVQVRLGADGRYAEALSQSVWDMTRRPFVRVDAEGQGVIPPDELWARMDGPLVFRHAVERMVASLQDVCAREGLAVDDLDLVLMHQANLRIVRSVQHLLDIPDEKVINNIQRYGNTTAATLPLLLDEAVRTGRFGPGKRAALVAFGSGFTWGAALLVG
jgi:3-oxoacyl-[acyl-carrier-protein] synthase-3